MSVFGEVWTDDPEGSWRIVKVTARAWSSGAELNKAMRDALICTEDEPTDTPMRLTRMGVIDVDLEWTAA